MKRFLSLIAVFALLQAGIFVALVLLSLPPDNLHAAAIDKERLLKETPSPRVVLVGGSAMAFGIDSATFADALGGDYRIVNMGLHAGLGLDFLLNETLDGLRKGDVVVISPEYDIVWADRPSHLEIAEVLRFQPSAYRYVEARHWAPTIRSAILEQPPVVLHDVAVNALRNQLPALGSGGVYWRSSFNSSGDNRSASELERTYKPTPEEMAPQSSAADYPQNLATIREFAMAARERGARVFYAPPPLLDERYAASREVVDKTVADMQGESGVQVLSTSAAEVFPLEAFFDSGNHLRGEAVYDRTRRIAEALRAALRDSPQ